MTADFCRTMMERYERWELHAMFRGEPHRWFAGERDMWRGRLMEAMAAMKGKPSRSSNN